MVVARVSFSLMAVLYAVELVLATTALGPSANVPFWLIERGSPQTRKEIAVLAARSGVSVDTRARGELLDESRRRGTEIVPAVMLADVLDAAGSSEPADADDLLPLGGISSTLTLLCNQGQVVSYASDEHGFRNPRGIWNSPRADIAVVGQSFAQGYCVRDGKGFVDLLRTHNQVALNLGTSGQSSLLQLAAIKEYLPRYEPKTVLWIFTEGIDLPDLYIESTHPLSRRYLDPTFSQHLLTRQPEIDAALRRVVSGIETREREAHAHRQPQLPGRTILADPQTLEPAAKAGTGLWTRTRGAAGVVHARADGGQSSEQCPGAGSDGGQFLGWHALLRLPSQLESISERAPGR